MGVDLQRMGIEALSLGSGDPAAGYISCKLQVARAAARTASSEPPSLLSPQANGSKCELQGHATAEVGGEDRPAGQGPKRPAEEVGIQTWKWPRYLPVSI